jgi:hypothetical protein
MTTDPGHVALLGDSIFDNARYVPGRPAVVEQVRQSLGPTWQASLLAVDGHVTVDVARQLGRLPTDATHLFVSVGGNDALGESGVLHRSVHSVAEAMALLTAVQARFRRDYREMLEEVLALDRPTVVCTIYDAIPGLEAPEVTALGIFNETILREALMARLPVIDLRLICNERSDYSEISPIEPSFTGGQKIADAIAHVATSHDFSRRQCVVYA